MSNKSWEKLVKEAFSKPMDERYEEFSKGEKIAYWVFILTIILIILLGWLGYI